MNEKNHELIKEIARTLNIVLNNLDIDEIESQCGINENCIKEKILAIQAKKDRLRQNTPNPSPFTRGMR